jgi:hypothetical protein
MELCNLDRPGVFVPPTIVPRLICRQGERVRKDTGNTVKFAQMIGVGDGRGPCNRMAGECYQISLGKSGLESDRILYKKYSHKGETICPQIKRGTTKRMKRKMLVSPDER